MNVILPAKLQVPWKSWLRWSASFAGFPLGGVAARLVVGNVDGPSAAILGGMAAGGVLGVAQALALPTGTFGCRISWAMATLVGMTGGLALGAGAVDYQTDTGNLVLMGALNGGAVGIAQAAVADTSAPRRVAWALLTPALWALGWFITAHVIVDADRQHAMFGSSGAIVATAASGLFLTLRVSAASSKTAQLTDRKVVLS